MLSAYVQRSIWKKRYLLVDSHKQTQTMMAHQGTAWRYLGVRLAVPLETAAALLNDHGQIAYPRPAYCVSLLHQSMMNNLPKVRCPIKDRFDAAQKPQPNSIFKTNSPCWFATPQRSARLEVRRPINERFDAAQRSQTNIVSERSKAR
jgi:hypothetical protein